MEKAKGIIPLSALHLPFAPGGRGATGTRSGTQGRHRRNLGSAYAYLEEPHRAGRRRHSGGLSCSSSTDDSARPAGSTGSADSASGDKAKAPEPKADLAVPVTGPQPDVLASSSDPKLKVTPEPDNSAPFDERVEHKLQEDLLARLKIPGKTSADCPDGVTRKA